MTLLFYLRSSNGSVAPGPYDWDYDTGEPNKKKRHWGNHLTLEQIEENKALMKEEDEYLLRLLEEDFDA